MKSLSLYLLLVLTQLVSIFAKPDRKLLFNFQNNAACILVNETAVNTNFKFNFHGTQQDDQVPMMIFNYLDLKFFKNLPNFDTFLNHTYLDEKKILEIGDDIYDDISFKLKTFRGAALPESLYTTVVTTDKELEYTASEPGVYCVYFPLYSYDGDIIHPTNYHAELQIDDFQSISVFNDISAHISEFLMFGLALVPLYYIYPVLRTKQVNKLPPVIQQLTQLLIVFVCLNVAHFVLELAYLFMPNDFLHGFSEVYFAFFKSILLEKWQKYIVALVYFGLGYVNSPVKSSKLLLQCIFTVNIISTCVFYYATGKLSSVTDITVNGAQYQVVYKSILVPRFYKKVALNQDTDFTKLMITISGLVQVVSSFLMQLLSFYYGLKLSWKFRGSKKLSKPIISSILFHLISWSTFGRHLMYQIFIQIRAEGIFDVGELLSNMGVMLEHYEVKIVGFQLVEILILLFIWTTKTPYDASGVVVEKENEKKKKGEKEKTKEKEKVKKETVKEKEVDDKAVDDKAVDDKAVDDKAVEKKPVEEQTEQSKVEKRKKTTKVEDD
ncbi:hypothetical protein KGF56_000171 [Candida oxycetoniae]|uniref:Intimal thickness related receptor IRP domain-containing protein n=1 Tax=Candida oxycetoniae TaxID=497107 RepID=A0AAI9X093_9ASCO|nr:uncharacterized protein KGF56_000171 [Candida oxycetoniae]KAI3406879.2 hypothetical protein KGF56_000171 [Candida oxycetoniae]